jgi:hypothetical protein
MIAEAGGIFAAAAHTEDTFAERLAARSFLGSRGRSGAYRQDRGKAYCAKGKN